jgi:predicted ABC-type ATPase
VPTLTVIAGPNGSGKSSFTRKLEFRDDLLNPDEVAATLSPGSPRNAAIQAGREILKRTAAYLKAGTSFGIETTLAGEGPLKTIRAAKDGGFSIHLIYIALDSPDRSIDRVSERVAQGGHDVPDGDVRRRYKRSLANAPEAVRLSDQASVFDNSGPQPEQMIEARGGVITWHAPNPPAWVTRIIEACRGHVTGT